MRDSARAAAGYRWIVLAVFMLAVLVNQAGWITFAAITVETASFYRVSDLAVGLLSLLFMAVYILLFLPAARLIDTLGFRTSVGIGAILTALGALGRGIFGMDALKAPDGSMTVPMIGLAAVLAACLVLSLFLKESPIARP